MNNDKPFLGQGLHFPPAFDKRRGDIVLVRGEEDIAQSLQIILSTELGERMLNPEFGANLTPLVFETIDPSLISLMEDTVRTALIYHEPRILVNGVRIQQTQWLEGEIRIEVDYTVRSTNSRFNFVYPFYLEEGSDVQRR